MDSADHISATGIPRSDSHYSTHHEQLTRHFGFFHPTRAEFFRPAEVDDEDQKGGSQWSSRASRKNRFAPRTIHVRHRGRGAGKAKGVSAGVVVEQRLRHPRSRLKVHLGWDVSFWVAVIFVLGSAAWIVNGCILFLPLVDVGGDHADAAFWWAFVGGTLFEVGSYLMLVEALNTGHDELFGPALWGLVSHTSLQSEDEKRPLHKRSSTTFRWIGLGSPRDLGYLACSIQMFAATVFWISTITGIPGVISNLATSPPTAIADVFFWTPQVVGGSGFIVASTLLMLEVQTKWWLPNLKSLGWHIAFWNLVGAIGFTLCGALGYASLVSTRVGYQSVLSTFWGSWAFEIGSVVQLWETLWREDPGRGGDGDAK